MKTKIIKINPKKIELNKIKLAATILKNGGLVAFPTETVYGLGANALSSASVKKIFKAKNRPADNPLIVHLADKKDLHLYVKNIPAVAEKLMNKFWPGPLTLIFEKSKIIPKATTAGLDCVAIRIPENKIALALIKESGLPLAAPSANLSTKTSPTLAKHVIADLNGKIEAIIDGGKARVGLESTVLDLTVTPPTLLRPGKITPLQIEKVIGKIEIISHSSNEGITKSPGTKYRHYSPETKLILIEGKEIAVKKEITKLLNKYKKQKKKIGVITLNKSRNYPQAELTKFIGATNREIASNLFKTLRELDEKNLDYIVSEGVEDKDLGVSIMNRLRKASSKIIKV
jgi:L-threonylcarbamoyladenylate synthase